MKLVLCVLCLAITMSACTHEVTNDNDDSWQEGNAAVHIVKVSQASSTPRSKHIILRFAPGQHRLNSEDKRQIAMYLMQNDIVEDSSKKIQVFSWADHEYPATVSSETKQEKDLAAARGKSMSLFIKSIVGKDSNVEIHNMADRPSEWAQLMGSDDAQLKKLLETSGQIPTGAGKRGAKFAKASQIMLWIE